MVGFLSSSPKPKMQMGVKKSEVAKGKGAPLGQDGAGSNKKAPLDGKGVSPGKTAKQTMVKNAVAAGKGSPANQKSAVQNGSTGKGQSQRVGNMSGGVGELPEKMSRTDQTPTPDKRVGKAPGGKNPFDLYADARK